VVGDVPIEAVLLVSFGGPEGPDDVVPFLENVGRGKNIPRARLQQVAERYLRLGGVSPHNAAMRALLRAVAEELKSHGLPLAVYWGNRCWHPLLGEVLGQMAAAGIRRAAAFVTSAFGSYPGCRAYLEAIQQAREEVGPRAPLVKKLRLYYNHPGFIAAVAERVIEACHRLPEARRPAARLLFTAHSIPLEMAQRCPYEQQLQEACRLVAETLSASGAHMACSAALLSDSRANAEAAGLAFAPGNALATWTLAFQSRSGPPGEPWLGPEVTEVLHGFARSGARDVIISPIGFVCENMDVAYDLDVEAVALCAELGINYVRAATVGAHPRFVRMVRELIEERLGNSPRRAALGTHGPPPDNCPTDCCLPLHARREGRSAEAP
jgi:ferrochelatase